MFVIIIDEPWKTCDGFNQPVNRQSVLFLAKVIAAL